MDEHRRWPWNVVLGVTLAFLLAPAFVVTISSFTASGYPQFPPESWSLRWYREIGAQQQFIDAFWYSLKLAALTAVVATAVGSLVAFAIVRHQFVGRSVLEAIFMAPLAMPGVVIGIGLLQLYSVARVPLSFWTMLSGHVLITLPFSIRLMMASLAGLDTELERAAMTLGASYSTVLRSVTFPMIRAGVFGSLAFSFIISFDEVSVSLFLSNIRTTTLPIRLYTFIEQNASPLVNAISALMLMVGIVVLLVIERVLGVQKAFVADD